MNNEITRRNFLVTSAGAAALVSCTGLEPDLLAQSVTLRPAAQRPWLLTGPEQLEDFKRKLNSKPSQRIVERFVERARAGQDTRVDPLIILALLEGTAQRKQVAGRALMQSFQKESQRPISMLKGEIMPGHQPRPGAVGPRYDFSNVRFVHRVLGQYDFVASFDVLSPEEHKTIRDYAIAATQVLLSPELRALNSIPANRRHNFHTDNIAVIATTALSFPDHPDAKAWLEYAATDFRWQMQNGVLDGAWHETPRYHGAVLRALVPVAHAIKRNTNTNFFDESNFKALLDWTVRIETSPDTVYGQWLLDGHASGSNGAETLAYPGRNLRLTPGVGDSEWASYWLANAAMAAPAYKDSDPAFAARLMYGWEQAGGPYSPEGDALLSALLLIDPGIKAVPQKLASENMPKAGYAVLRSGYGSEDENYFLLVGGHRREEHWAHHAHRDVNSFSLFAYGVPLALDPGSGMYGTAEQALWYRATVSHNTVQFGGLNQDYEDGNIVRFVSKPGADYVVCDGTRAAGEVARVLQFYRHVVFVKPDYYVIWDFIRAFVPTEWMINSPAKRVMRNELGFTLETPWSVDLDAHFLLPEAQLQIEEGEGRFGAWRTEQDKGAPPFTHQKYVRVKNQLGKDFLTVLHPRKSQDEKVTVRRIGSEEHVIEVTRAGQRDLILLFPETREYQNDSLNLKFKGRAAVVRQGKVTESTLLDGEMLSANGNGQTLT